MNRILGSTTTSHVLLTIAGAGGLVSLAGCGSTKQDVHALSVQKFSPEARLEAEYRDEEFSGGAGAATKETIFRENLQFDFDSSVYHPKLMTLGGVLDLGLEQRVIDQRGVDETIRSNDDRIRYDLRSTLLKDHPYSLQLFAQRTQSSIRQSFFPTEDALVTREGATVMAKEWVIPSQIEVSRYNFVGESDDLRRERRDTINATGSANTERTNVYYQVFAQEVDSELAGGQYDDLQALGGATWRFGERNSNSISIDGQSRNQTGDVESASDQLGTTLLLDLSEDVTHRSGVSRGLSEFGGPDNRTARTDAFAEFEHRLYDSLTTVVRGDYLEQDIGPGDLRRIGGSGRMAYRKQVSFGELQLGYQIGRAQQDEDGRFGANVTVTDEPHVVVFGDPVILANPEVNEGAILVTDASGTIVYSSPADYIVEQIGRNTRLVFPGGSQIVPGQTILVTYTYAATQDRSFSSDTQQASIGVIFGEGLSMNAYWSKLDQSLISGIPDETLDQATEFGIGMRAKALDQNVELEYLDRDSMLTPYSRIRASWYTWLPVDDAISVSLNAQAYDTTFKEDQLHERGLSGLAAMTLRHSDELSWEVRSEVRRSNLRTDEGWGLFLQSILQYRWRKSSVEFTVINSREDWMIASDRDIMRAMLTFRRRF